MSSPRLCALALLVSCAALAWGQSPRRGVPTAGYIYPAGGKQGTTVHVAVGGQNLAGVRAVHVGSAGVRGVAVDYARPLNRKQLRDVGEHLRVLMRMRWAQLMGKPVTSKDEEDLKALEPLPDHPWLRGLDKKKLKELDDLRLRLFNPKAQPNAQLEEIAYLDLTIDAHAAPGLHDLRVETPNGLSDPVHFTVGSLPEVSEAEPNSMETAGTVLDLPVVLDGQVMPGDTDVWRFRARRGQKLTLTTQARSLVPYLADAVPGWFQATLTLYDAQGREVAFNDDYRFDPDPVIFYQVPQDGEYALEIRDSIYRGREDFVYRITVGEQPFVTSLFPPGGTVGKPLTAQLTGWNVPTAPVKLDTTAGGPTIRHVSWQWGNKRSNTVAYAVDDLTDSAEAEPNDTVASAQKVSWPLAVDGRVGKPGDVDAYRLEGRAGDELVVEVQARRLGSPLDSLVRVRDAAGRVTALNDDHDDKQATLLTHQADSWLSVKLPKAGAYTVLVSDAQAHGGEEYFYRLCLRAPHPDFALQIAPSSLKLDAGRTQVLEVHVLRLDGFSGPVELALGGMTGGFVLNGGRVGAGQDVVHATVTAPTEPPTGAVALQVVGKAQMGGATVTRTAAAADEMMQAFAYWHLVPAQEFAVVVGPAPRWPPRLDIVSDGAPLRLSPGGTAQVQIKTPPVPTLIKSLRLELKSAPEGVTIKEQNALPSGLALTVQADRAKVKPGSADNLIVEVFIEAEVKRGNGQTVTVRNSVGVLPAVPVEVVP
ncbi:PPC domain-containing protein [bacterium]|nr:PPC domain-containing protein [bacterium]